ncbi:PREDICTED: mas-related G-protein coupled receptor member H-like [Nanorana parkeri]|uniref:mas-related G-protein coupled receptor member H-like n=1 Tax=Nanorana parkeri TaxID=125878 RepID=UPI000854EC4D|nr:PREDICTED: mas-related G-protein coupled receptor member H-like [Nanorana parkeri]
MDITRLDASSQNLTWKQGSNDLDSGQRTIVFAFFLFASVVGLVGNLIVFWYLCFKIQRNKYTIYINNLSAADALLETVAVIILMVNINTFNGPNPEFNGKQSFVLSLTILYYAMIYTGMFLLTAISTERCVSALFPIWNTVRRPRHLSTIMCCFAWAIGSLESLLQHFVCGTENTGKCLPIGVLNFVLAIGICLPLMVISSLILLIKIKRTFRQRYPPKLYIIIIVAAVVFTLSVLPLNTVRFLLYCNLTADKNTLHKMVTVTEFWMIVNSAINPCIYFLVGRRWNRCTCYSIKDTLNRAFTVDIND